MSTKSSVAAVFSAAPTEAVTSSIYTRKSSWTADEGAAIAAEQRPAVLELDARNPEKDRLMQEELMQTMILEEYLQNSKVSFVYIPIMLKRFGIYPNLLDKTLQRHMSFREFRKYITERIEEETRRSNLEPHRIKSAMIMADPRRADRAGDRWCAWQGYYYKTTPAIPESPRSEEPVSERSRSPHGAAYVTCQAIPEAPRKEEPVWGRSRSPHGASDGTRSAVWDDAFRGPIRRNNIYNDMAQAEAEQEEVPTAECGERGEFVALSLQGI